ncbi:PepSY domain-containing protein [Paenibacillus sinopodophylli]|uniref:PepSY domain-containing protein n=1 Tax=Paenibacillus sinopodophylli TaxID=1837342 RepID=UPI001485C71E|nr:PepSY domain-containing protein [Paenibacillus sinopodophylli]
MMNKKGWIVGLGLVVVLGGTSAAVAAEAASSYISKDKAKQIALKAAPGKVTDIDLERDRNTVYYEVDIDRKDTFQEVDVHVEAVTGKVLSIKNDDDAPRVTAAPTSGAAASNSATASHSTSTASTNTSTTTKSVTKEEAGKIAQQQVKGDVIRVETDWDDGIKKYEVKLRTATGTAEVDIAAASGKVLDVDYDDDRDNDYDDDRDDDDHDDDFDDRD